MANKNNDDKEMTVREHLGVIKKGLIWLIIPSIVIFFIYFSLSDFIINKFLELYHIKAVTLSPLEYINTQLNLSGMLTLVSVIPLILTELYLFTRPAIKKEYRKKIVSQIVYSSILAVFGVCFGIFVFASFTFNFLSNYGQIPSMWGIGSIFNYIIFSALAFGVIFQIVIIIPFLDKTGLLKVEFFKNKRKYLLIVILLISALITPTVDIFTMSIMAIPTYSAFELGILLSKLKRRKNGTGI